MIVTGHQRRVLAAAIIGSVTGAMLIVLTSETQYSAFVGLWLAGLIFTLTLLPSIGLAVHYGLRTSWIRLLAWIVALTAAYPILFLVFYGFIERYEVVGEVAQPQGGRSTLATVLLAAAMSFIVWLMSGVLIRCYRITRLFQMLASAMSIAALAETGVLSSRWAFPLAFVLIGGICGAGIAMAAPGHKATKP
jgi:hypothetical protein